MTNARPAWCPFLDADANITCVKSCECKGVSREKKGASVFCMGKTQECSFDIDGHRHTNGYIFCANIPFATKFEYKICSLLVNKQDMTILHKLIHAAIDDDGFMANKEEIC